MRLAVYISLATGLLCAQNRSELIREGPYYVHTMSGSLDGRLPAQLQIVTRGNVVLRGSKGDQITYKLVQRVKAHSIFS